MVGTGHFNWNAEINLKLRVIRLANQFDFPVHVAVLYVSVKYRHDLLPGKLIHCHV